MTDLIAHLTRQGAFGRATFGSGPRTEGVLKHIESEIEEVRRAAAEGDLDELVKEWTDIAILGLDGLIRAVRAREEAFNAQRMLSLARPYITHDEVARIAVDNIVGKQAKNEMRDWPDWRGKSEDQPIEHDRSQGVQ
ncbi:MazG-like nucleotide pyrophosphohydrolase [Rhodobacter phage RcPescado]|nr:MazG-like nucleotide pyrophosphohydrolase [Rhodobacter phage RcPescado]